MQQPTLFDTGPPPPAPREDAAEELRRWTNRKAVLAALRTGPKTCVDLSLAGGHRFSARIAELRREGHDILTERIGRGLYRYTLLSEAPQPRQ